MEINRSSNVLSFSSEILTGYAYVHSMQKVTTKDTTLVWSDITDSLSSTSVSVDSYYIISEIRLPDHIVTNGYYTINDKIYDLNGNEISVEQLLATSILNTNIIRVDTNYVFYYYIETYYIDLLKSRFQETINSCACLNKQDKITIDTLTMGLDIIKYLIPYELYNEIQRVIEQLSVCTGTITNNCACYG